MIDFDMTKNKQNLVKLLTRRVSVQPGICGSGRTLRMETFEQLINVGADRQFMVSKAPQRKTRKR